jgi:hypothetical protein
MSGPKGLSPRVVRSIFESTESAPAAAKRHKVSANLVYLIRRRRIHKAVTEGLRAPRRPKSTNGTRAPIDVYRLADAISKKVVKELVNRLRGKG